MVSAVLKADGLSVTLRSTPAFASAGGTFTLTLNLRNLSRRDASFELPTEQAFDFQAFDSAGGEVWRWSSGVMFAQVATKLRLVPGESLVYKVAWDADELPEGLYTVSGCFLGLPGTAPAVTVEVGGT